VGSLARSFASRTGFKTDSGWPRTGRPSTPARSKRAPGTPAAARRSAVFRHPRLSARGGRGAVRGQDPRL